MARRFSLKDNPIFQKMEVPKPKDFPFDSSEGSPEISTTGQVIEDRKEILEGQNLTLKDRPSKFDPQNGPDSGNTSIPKADRPRQEADSAQRWTESQDSREENQFQWQAEAPSELLHLPRTETLQEENKDLKLSSSVPDNYQQNLSQEKSSGILHSHPEDTNVIRSIFEGQILTLKNHSEQEVQEDKETRDPLVLASLPSDSPELSEPTPEILEGGPEQNWRKKQENSQLIERIDKSEFFSIYNEVTDTLLPTLPPAEQILYSRLFRLSFGFNKNYCTVSHPLLRERTGLSRNTIRTGLQSLVKKQWLHVIEAGNHVSTTYRVILPREKELDSFSEGQNLTLKNRPSKIDPQNLSLKTGGSNFAPLKGQNLGVQKLTPKTRKGKISNKNNLLYKGGVKSDPQNLTPLLITNNSLTLSEGVKNFSSDKENSQIATTLVDEFYSLLSQHPSSAKRQRSINECLGLLLDGFSKTQISYANQWTIKNLPSTGSFSRVVHFIDQALKSQEREEQMSERERERDAASQQQHLQEKQQEEEERRIDEIKTQLSPQEIEVFTEEATRLVDAEHGNLRYGRGTLIQIKVRSLIRLRYLRKEKQEQE